MFCNTKTKYYDFYRTKYLLSEVLKQISATSCVFGGPLFIHCCVKNLKEMVVQKSVFSNKAEPLSR